MISLLSRRLLAPALLLLAVGALLLDTSGCGSASGSPLAEYRQQFQDRPQYAVTLDNMKVGGDMYDDYYHKYRILEASRGSNGNLSFDRRTTDWKRVSEDFYRQHRNDLGMTLLAKGPDGDLVEQAQPAGYQYVGNPQYGQWVNRNGNEVWQFAGGMAAGAVMAEGIDRKHYRAYKRARKRGRSYYGNGRYGTSGSVMKSARPNFYERRKARRARARKARQRRARRSRGSRSRSRSGGFGK